LGSPDVIILDEPTVGLDPKQIIEIRDLIKELGKTHTIILSSHILSEVSAICDYVMIISHGRLVASDTPENLSKKMAGSNILRIAVRGNESATRGALKDLAGINCISFEEAAEPGTVQVVLDCSKDRDVRDRVFYALADAKAPILSMAHENLTLEDVFLKLTSDGDTIAANKAAKTPDQTKEERQ
jgi:ABC-2 type transport system ATP-binding protein